MTFRDHSRPAHRMPSLPREVCFRVTRFCNAQCGFCLAPPDGSHPDARVLEGRVQWLLDHGVATLHLCGGEPTIHPALPGLLQYIHHKGGRLKLTTNGITASDGLIDALSATRTAVKVSLHGDRAHHNMIVGCDAFDALCRNVRRLLAAGITTSLQTTIVKDAEWVVPWAVDFCVDAGIRRVSFMPFIPRGSGAMSRQDYELSVSGRRKLHDLVSMKRRAMSGQLDVRWLDFTARPVHVVESDGRIVLEGATEAMDTLLGRIPEDSNGDQEKTAKHLLELKT